MKSVADIATDRKVTQDRVTYVITRDKIDHDKLAGRTRLYGAPKVKQILAAIKVVDKQREQGRKNAASRGTGKIAARAPAPKGRRKS